MEMTHPEALGPSCPAGTHSEHEHCIIALQAPRLAAKKGLLSFHWKKKNNVLVIVIV